jgi:hypothetical protein
MEKDYLLKDLMNTIGWSILRNEVRIVDDMVCLAKEPNGYVFQNFNDLINLNLIRDICDVLMLKNPSH